MSRRLHVHQCFQSVGHGTFFTGAIWDEHLDQPIFNWVYDCGSKRKTKVEAVIKEVDRQVQMLEEIDLFVLSHFDDDHVNGVEQFLKGKRVRWLAIPYLDMSQRLEEVVSGSSTACSASTALFQLDPLQWLNSRGLSERVGAVLFVRGGTSGEDETPVPADRGPERNKGPSNERERPDEFFEDSIDHSAQERAPLEAVVSPLMSNASLVKGKIAQMLHMSAFGPVGLPIEFMFFNSEQPDLFLSEGDERVARKSLVPITVLQDEVEAVIHLSGLDGSSRLNRMWRSELREIFDRHFGSSGQARNNISLCLMVRPLINVEPCELFDKRNGILDASMKRGGLLCLGDLRIDTPTIQSMQAHFGPERWRSLAAVQVPHHGSKHSWESGSAAKFSPDHFIHCVPDRSGGHHPHKDVKNDLGIVPVHRADYSSKVVVDYHFLWKW